MSMELLMMERLTICRTKLELFYKKMDGRRKNKIDKWVEGILIKEKQEAILNDDYCACHIDRFAGKIPKKEWLSCSLEIKDYLTRKGLNAFVAVYISPRKRGGCIPRRFDASLLNDHCSDTILDEDLFFVAPPNVYLRGLKEWSLEDLKKMYGTLVFNEDLSYYFDRTVYSAEWFDDSDTNWKYLRAIVFI